MAQEKENLPPCAIGLQRWKQRSGSSLAALARKIQSLECHPVTKDRLAAIARGKAKPTYDQFISIAKGINISLDILGGFKQPKIIDDLLQFDEDHKLFHLLEDMQIRMGTRRLNVYLITFLTALVVSTIEEEIQNANDEDANDDLMAALETVNKYLLNEQSSPQSTIIQAARPELKQSNLNRRKPKKKK